MNFPILHTWLDEKPEFDFSKLYIVAEQHLLSTTGSLIDRFIEIGVIPHHIFMTGKIYSTNEQVAKEIEKKGVQMIYHSSPNKLGYYSDFLISDIKKMWRQAIKIIPKDAYVIVLDDGGYTLKNIPREIINSSNVIGIEQTTSGTRFMDSINVPVINVAGSISKMLLESPLISKALVEKIHKLLEEDKPTSIGILGCGNIGRAIISYFSKHLTTYFYDIESEKMNEIYHLGMALSSADELFEKADIIIGATGKDVSSITWYDLANTNKTLISVSSGDTEFKSLLKSVSQEVDSIVDDVIIPTNSGHSIKIIRGGTVANFDNSPSSVATEEIQLTRGLLYASFIQALEYFNGTEPQKKLLKLNATYQREVVKMWFENYPKASDFYPVDVIENFSNVSWIEKESK
jgi:S-adenosylhomocysteine hydrolase